MTFDGDGQPSGTPQLCPITGMTDATHITVGDNVYSGTACAIPNSATIAIRECSPIWAAHLFYPVADNPVRCQLTAQPNGSNFYGDYGDLMAPVKEANSYWQTPDSATP